MYFHYFDTLTQLHHLIEYDLSSEIPRLIRAAAIPGFPSSSGRLMTTLDSRRRSLLFLDTFGQSAGTQIRIFNLATFRMDPSTWSLLTAVPGFVATGITYASQDDRVYLLGRLSGQGAVEGALGLGLAPSAGPPTVVVALDPKDRKVAWIRPIKECLQPMAFFGLGSFLGRSSVRDALYFFCVSGSLTGIVQYPGATGLVRLSIASRAAQKDVLSFQVEFFPVSGAYTTNGGTAVAGLDHPSDRFFVQSLSDSTPGAWAFDGNISAWVGLIAAPDSLDQYLGINEGSGHYYMSSNIDGGGKSYLLVSNARMTPPPQGDVFPLPGDSDIVTDPLSRRLFVPLLKKKGEQPLMYAMRDDTPDPQQDQVINYDDLTTDVAEGPGTISEYSGTVNGFGARVFLVGGIGGAESFVGGADVFGTIQSLKDSVDSVTPQSVRNQGVPVPAIQKGDRGVYLAQVGALDLRNSGAASSVQAVAPDSGTADEYQSYLDFLSSTKAAPAATVLAWPYPAAACLDGGGQRIDEKKTDAEAVCDLGKSESAASSTVTAISIGPLTVGSASFVTEATRTDLGGALTTTTAVAKGIELSFPGVGALSIGRVTATATTAAHGRPGTAQVKYTRQIQDVIVTDGSGKETFSCAATCNPEDVAKAVNTNLGAKVRMDIPPADTRATARGAFAGVRKTTRDSVGGQAQNNDSSNAVPAIEFSINNDSAGKSRLHIQLAAIQASSIYGISLLSGGLPDNGGVIPPIPVPVPNIIPPIPTGPGPQPGPFINNPRTPIPNGLRGALLLGRSVKDAVVVLLMFALIGGAIGTAYRRHTLIQHLEEEAG